MKTNALILAAGLLGGLLNISAQEPAPKKTPAIPAGSREYQVALFKRGPNWGKNPAEAKELQTERAQYLTRLDREGKIALMGTFTDRGLYHSMIVFKAASVAEAKAWVAEMPSIKSELLVYEIHPWLSLDGIRIVQPRPGGPGSKAPPATAAPKKQGTPADPKKAD
jgi:uncharacterized protein YciI